MTAAPGYIDRLYGRRDGKPLKPRQARLMETLLPRLSVPDPQAGPVDPAALFPGVADVRLEIGFGGGEHLAWQAARAPAAGFLGAEPFRQGVGKALAAFDEARLGNVRIHMGDGRTLMRALPDASLTTIYVLHPDPWPKARHRKRRLVSPWFFAEATRLLKPGGIVRVASDIPDYVAWTLTHARAAPAFDWTARRADDWRNRPADWPQTRYEAKARREGRPPAYLVFRRRQADRSASAPAAASRPESVAMGTPGPGWTEPPAR